MNTTAPFARGTRYSALLIGLLIVNVLFGLYYLYLGVAVGPLSRSRDFFRFLRPSPEWVRSLSDQTRLFVERTGAPPSVFLPLLIIGIIVCAVFLAVIWRGRAWGGYGLVFASLVVLGLDLITGIGVTTLLGLGDLAIAGVMLIGLEAIHSQGDRAQPRLAARFALVAFSLVFIIAGLSLASLAFTGTLTWGFEPGALYESYINGNPTGNFYSANRLIETNTGLLAIPVLPLIATGLLILYLAIVADSSGNSGRQSLPDWVIRSLGLLWLGALISFPIYAVVLVSMLYDSGVRQATNPAVVMFIPVLVGALLLTGQRIDEKYRAKRS